MSSAASSTPGECEQQAAGRGTHPAVVSLARFGAFRPAGFTAGRALFGGGCGVHAVNVRSDLIANNGKSDTPYAQLWM